MDEVWWVYVAKSVGINDRYSAIIAFDCWYIWEVGREIILALRVYRCFCFRWLYASSIEGWTCQILLGRTYGTLMVMTKMLRNKKSYLHGF